jgi:hypothetical protein
MTAEGTTDSNNGVVTMNHSSAVAGIIIILTTTNRIAAIGLVIVTTRIEAGILMIGEISMIHVVRDQHIQEGPSNLQWVVQQATHPRHPLIIVHLEFQA